MVTTGHNMSFGAHAHGDKNVTDLRLLDGRTHNDHLNIWATHKSGLFFSKHNLPNKRKVHQPTGTDTLLYSESKKRVLE
jgi:hypothetical protein